MKLQYPHVGSPFSLGAETPLLNRFVHLGFLLEFLVMLMAQINAFLGTANVESRMLGFVSVD
jgi:hypothetical protein